MENKNRIKKQKIICYGKKAQGICVLLVVK